MCVCADTHTHARRHTHRNGTQPPEGNEISQSAEMERPLEGIVLNEIPQISRFHAEPTKRYTMNRTEPNRNRLIDNHKGIHGLWPEEGGGETGGHEVGERMSECH